MSDEFILDRYTFCVIFDRNDIFDFHNYWFSKFGHVTPEDMEMSVIAVRIEWQHSRIPAGPLSGSKSPSEEAKFRFSQSRHLFSEFGRNGKWENHKKCYQGGAKFFWAYGTGPRSFVALGVALASIKGHIPRERLQCC